MATAGEFLDSTLNTIKNIATKEGRQILESNKAINPITNFTGGIEAASRILGGEGISNSLVKTFAKNAVEKDGKLVADEAGYNYGKIAGSYLGVAAAGRVLTGGGIYKDGNGNTNLIGVPFV
jgi:hypothetical protein